MWMSFELVYARPPNPGMSQDLLYLSLVEIRDANLPHKPFFHELFHCPPSLKNVYVINNILVTGIWRKGDWPAHQILVKVL